MFKKRNKVLGKRENDQREEEDDLAPVEIEK